MSDSHPVAKPRTEHTLLATADPMVWAQEFCRIFQGYTITTEPAKVDIPAIDPGTMVGWFANAMQTALNNQQVEDEDTEDYLEEKFLEGFAEGRTEDDR